jgi:hypothetical protein
MSLLRIGVTFLAQGDSVRMTFVSSSDHSAALASFQGWSDAANTINADVDNRNICFESISYCMGLTVLKPMPRHRSYFFGLADNMSWISFSVTFGSKPSV